MNKLRVLVVDDSAYNRRTIAELLAAIEGVEVVGKATDGDEALRQATKLRPDLITLDLEMPRMDGFTFLRLLMARRPTPVLVVSGYANKENVFRALELGALDFIAKPARVVSTDLSSIQAELTAKVQLVRQLSPTRLTPLKRMSQPPADKEPSTDTSRRRRTTQRMGVDTFATADTTKVLVLGASTGGPTAILDLFARLPLGYAVVVAQHMPEKFTETFAERLNRLGGLHVREASGTHALEPGLAYICPGGRCIEVVRRDNALVANVVPPLPFDRYIPSVDRLFRTAAVAAGSNVIGVVLTGMGDDGARGVEAIKKAGGIVLAEAPESAVIYGMPGAAVRTGAVDQSLSLSDLPPKLTNLLG